MITLPKWLWGSKSKAKAPATDVPRWMQQASASSFGGGWQGGQIDRQTEDWRPGTVGPNRVFTQNGKLLRERARDLADNNPFAASAIEAYVANVIESGIHPERDEAWEKAWNRWGGLTAHATRECDISQDLTITEMQALWLREIIVGGGCLAHYVTMPRRSQRVPLAIELISEEQFAEHLMWSGPNRKTANQVINGIEIDSRGRTVAYHILKSHPNDEFFDAEEVIRLPAEHCEYAFIRSGERNKAKRGSTLLKPVVQWLWALGFYTDNELATSHVRSAWSLVVKTDSDRTDLSDGAPMYDTDGNRITKLRNAMIWWGGPEDKVETVGPNVPTQESIPWIQLIQRAIAIGCRLSYEETFRDYSKGSFSSVRMARGQDIKRFRPLQGFTINHFLNPTVRRFDLAAVGAGIDGLPSPATYLERVDDILDSQEWRVPGWESPNPKDDATADKMNLESKIISRQEIVQRRGGSYKWTIGQLGYEKQLIEENGMQDISSMAAPGTDTGSTADEPEQEAAE